eukprot:5216252-Ditylum_brightwellii.AAC.1
MERKKREDQVSFDMNNRQEMLRRERKVLETQAEEYYRKKKTDLEEEKSIQSRIEHDFINVRSLKRRLAKEEEQHTKAEMLKMLADRDQIDSRAWEEEWKKKKHQRCEQYKVHCLHCLTNPDTQEEKKMGTHLKELIKKRENPATLIFPAN